MPGGVALLWWQRRDESRRGRIVEREKRKALPTIEARDGTRREAADSSVAVVEQDRSPELARHDAILADAHPGTHGLVSPAGGHRHARSLARPRRNVRWRPRSAGSRERGRQPRSEDQAASVSKAESHIAPPYPQDGAASRFLPAAEGPGVPGPCHALEKLASSASAMPVPASGAGDARRRSRLR